jgi:hypothetical protein
MKKQILLASLLIALFAALNLTAQTRLTDYNRSLGKSGAMTFDPTLKPFYHGVASGDPLADKVIIWTRITPDSGDITPKTVNWIVATDTSFQNIIKTGIVTTDNSKDYTIKVDVTGLNAATTYYYVFKYNGFSLLGEYVNTSARVPMGITQRVRADGTTATTFDVNGVSNVENYVKNRMMLGEGYNLQGGYVFKNRVAVDGRVSYLKPQTYSFLNNATFYNRSNYYTIGVSKYLSRGYGAKIQLDCTYINAKNGSNDLNGNPIKGNEFLTRLITTISF